MAIYRKSRPAGHPDIGQGLTNLGLVQRELGEFAAARKSHEEALAIRRRVLPRVTVSSPTASTTWATTNGAWRITLGPKRATRRR